MYKRVSEYYQVPEADCPEDYRDGIFQEDCFMEQLCGDCPQQCIFAWRPSDTRTVFVWQDGILYGAMTIWALGPDPIQLAKRQVGNFLPLFTNKKVDYIFEGEEPYQTCPHRWKYHFFLVSPTLWPGKYPERTTGVQTWYPVGGELVDFTLGKHWSDSNKGVKNDSSI